MDGAYSKPRLVVLDEGYKAASGACSTGGVFGCNSGPSAISGACNPGSCANSTCGTGSYPGGVCCFLDGASANCNCQYGGVASGVGGCGPKCTCGAKEGKADCAYGYNATPNQCCTGDIG